MTSNRECFRFTRLPEDKSPWVRVELPTRELRLLLKGMRWLDLKKHFLFRKKVGFREGERHLVEITRTQLEYIVLTYFCRTSGVFSSAWLAIHVVEAFFGLPERGQYHPLCSQVGHARARELVAYGLIDTGLCAGGCPKHGQPCCDLGGRPRMLLCRLAYEEGDPNYDPMEDYIPFPANLDFSAECVKRVVNRIIATYTGCSLAPPGCITV